MSNFNEILDIIKPVSISVSSSVTEDKIDPKDIQGKPFDVQVFIQELADHSEKKEREYVENATQMNGHDIASGCIGYIVRKLLNIPVPSYAHNWLPILFRATLGKAVHEFIQGYTNQFTEIEKSLKVPSINFSGRLDYLSGNNILGEIKSCTWKDYQKIIKTQTPRTEDFYQSVCYKYILENYLE